MPSTTSTTTFGGGLRTYPWQGRPLISATSLRQALGSPYGLVLWAHKEIAAFAIDEIEDLVKRVVDFNNLVAAGKPIQAAERHEDTMKWLVAAATAKRDKAAKRGSAIHKAVEESTPDDLIPSNLIGPVRQERIAMNELGITPLLREKTVFNLTLGYAGTFDLIGLKDGKVTMVDLKTGSGIYTDHAIQLALYVEGEFIGHDDVIDQQSTDILHQVEAAGILHLSDDSYEWVEVPLSNVLGDAMRAQATLANFYALYPDIASLPEGAIA